MHIRTLRHAARLFAAAWAVTVLPAFGQECSNSDFRGRYGVQAKATFVPGGVEGKDNWAVGTVVADGAGVITEWKDTWTGVPPSSDSPIVVERNPVAAAAAMGEQVTYSVSPDCRIAIRAPLGPFVLETAGVLVNGGREVLHVQVKPPNGTAGSRWVAVEPDGDSDSIREQLDSMQKQLDSVKEQLGRIALRNGLIP